MPRTSALRPVAFVLAALAAALPLHAVPRPHHRANAREQILALENQWRLLQLADDVAGMEKLLSDDYIGITISGQAVTKAQQLERIRMRKIVVTRFDLSDTKVKLIANGQVAVVNTLVQVKGTSDTGDLNGSFRYTRVYQRLPNGTWKITNFEATRVPKGAVSANATPATVTPEAPANSNKP